MKRPTTLLADDHPLVLAGLERLLESDFKIVGTVGDGVLLLAEAARLRPDLIIADISMPSLSGLDVTRRLIRIRPESKIVILTMHADPAFVMEAISAGACAYLLKRDATDELIGALHEVLGGKTHFPILTEEWSEAGPGNDLSPEFMTAKLTVRQRQILQLIADGKTHKEIASELHMSPKTVEFHKYRMTRVLGLHTTAELTRAAIRAGIGRHLDVSRAHCAP